MMNYRARAAECELCSDPAELGWNLAARGETEAQRNDRNFVEILQELRVAQTGVQILFAFLLTLALTDRFANATHFQHVVYMATLCDTAAALVVIICPVSLHRLTFRRRLKAQVVRTASVLAIVGLFLLALAVSGSVLLATSVASPGAAPWVTSSVAFFAFLLWAVLPLVVRHGHNHLIDEHSKDLHQPDS